MAEVKEGVGSAMHSVGNGTMTNFRMETRHNYRDDFLAHGDTTPSNKILLFLQKVMKQHVRFVVFSILFRRGVGMRNFAKTRLTRLPTFHFFLTPIGSR